MTGPVISIGLAQGPFAVSLIVTGGLPVNWTLYRYVKDSAGALTLEGPLCAGEGTTPAAVPSLKPGDLLSWSVKALNLGPPQPADVSASLLVNGHAVSTTAASQVIVSPDQPFFYFYVGVTP